MPRGRRARGDREPGERPGGGESVDAEREPFRSLLHVVGGDHTKAPPARGRCGAARGCPRRACLAAALAHGLACGDAARAAASCCAPATAVAARGRDGMRRGGNSRSTRSGGAGNTEGSCTFFGTSSVVPCEPPRTNAGRPPGRRAGALSLAGKRSGATVHVGSARRRLSETGFDRWYRRHFLGL